MNGRNRRANFDRLGNDCKPRLLNFELINAKRQALNIQIALIVSG